MSWMGVFVCFVGMTSVPSLPCVDSHPNGPALDPELEPDLAYIPKFDEGKGVLHPYP